MDPLLASNQLDKESDATATNNLSIEPTADVHLTLVPSNDPTGAPTIVVNSMSDERELTVTPAFANFPTDEEVVLEPDHNVLLGSNKNVSEQGRTFTSLPAADPSRLSQQSSPLLEELKYLLRPTNSLASPAVTIQASQEADLAIKRRTIQFEDDWANNPERVLIEGLTPQEAKSLGAAERRSYASKNSRLLGTVPSLDRARAHSMQPTVNLQSSSPPPASIVIAHAEHHPFLERLSGLIWAFLAAYAFSIILFLTKSFGIDLIFGFFLQMSVQVIAFAIYAIYKGYNLLGPSEHRIAMIGRAFLIGIGTLTAFVAYYYITLPELSTVRQTQVILTVVLSIFFLRERITIARIFACILTIISIVVLIRPTSIAASSYPKTSNETHMETSWVPYTARLNHIIGIGLALFTALAYSVASIMNKIYFSAQHLHNTVLCFWSALSGLIISIILVIITHFFIDNVQSFPHDWRLFVGIGLGLASIFAFIANQKAIKRERASIVTLIYATDIILVLILQNVFTNIKSDVVVILGCVLILVSVLIICIEVLIVENRQKTLAIRVAQVATTTTQDNGSKKSSTTKRLSI